jgi:hypothetical protein
MRDGIDAMTPVSKFEGLNTHAEGVPEPKDRTACSMSNVHANTQAVLALCAKRVAA